ncbi:leucyl aminopeptidase [Desulfobacterales bacterium HSG16]|nr:leucyl aminopeptidase [Desulfobacterales bacterium HSG16]
MLDLVSIDLKKKPVSALIVPVCEDIQIHGNRAIASLEKKACEIPEFNGKSKEEIVLYNPENIAADRVFFIGIGSSEKLTLEKLRAFAGKAVNRAIGKKINDILIALPTAKKIGMNTSEMIEAMFEGAFLANHRFDIYKDEKEEAILEKIEFLAAPVVIKACKNLPNRVETICRNTLLAREWVNIPSNDKTPKKFIDMISKIAKKEDLSITVLDEKKLKRLKMNALLAVGAGSSNRPGLIALEYRAENAEETVVLVGKGVTFDSGGLNLKPGGSLDNMKTDMAGGAAVAATLLAISRLKPNINVTGVIPVVENMPSGSAVRPGDVIKTFSGKTVEIGNTDAEGRLILADAMAWAIKEYEPRIMIDAATLTGACLVALGTGIAGLFTYDDDLAASIIEAAEKTHERCWRMPLPDDYKESIKSEIADMNNISKKRWGGAINAALFLAEFTKDTRWAHIDIAGPSSLEKGQDYCPAGGTGFGVRLLCNFIDSL